PTWAGGAARLGGSAESAEVVVEHGGQAVARHAVAWSVGRRSLQQLLATFPGGRLQPLPVGFDRPRAQWLAVFADDPRQPADWGYWTNGGTAANTHCLPCHTTGFSKGYDAPSNTYRSQWAEPAVACEACHGPGSRHVEARRRGADVGYAA